METDPRREATPSSARGPRAPDRARARRFHKPGEGAEPREGERTAERAADVPGPRRVRSGQPRVFIGATVTWGYVDGL